MIEEVLEAHKRSLVSLEFISPGSEACRRAFAATGAPDSQYSQFHLDECRSMLSAIPFLFRISLDSANMYQRIAEAFTAKLLEGSDVERSALDAIEQLGTIESLPANSTLILSGLLNIIFWCHFSIPGTALPSTREFPEFVRRFVGASLKIEKAVQRVAPLERDTNARNKLEMISVMATMSWMMEALRDPIPSDDLRKIYNDLAGVWCSERHASLLGFWLVVFIKTNVSEFEKEIRYCTAAVEQGFSFRWLTQLIDVFKTDPDEQAYHFQLFEMCRLWMYSVDLYGASTLFDFIELYTAVVRDTEICCDVFWKADVSTRCEFVLNLCKLFFPYDFSRLIKLCSSLATGKENAGHVADTLSFLSNFCVSLSSIEDLSTKCMIDDSSSTLTTYEAITARNITTVGAPDSPDSLLMAIIPPNVRGKIEATLRGTVTWNMDYNGWPIILSAVDAFIKISRSASVSKSALELAIFHSDRASSSLSLFTTFVQYNYPVLIQCISSSFSCARSVTHEEAVYWLFSRAADSLKSCASIFSDNPAVIGTILSSFELLNVLCRVDPAIVTLQLRRVDFSGTILPSLFSSPGIIVAGIELINSIIRYNTSWKGPQQSLLHQNSANEETVSLVDSLMTTIFSKTPFSPDCPNSACTVAEKLTSLLSYAISFCIQSQVRDFVLKSVSSNTNIIEQLFQILRVNVSRLADDNVLAAVDSTLQLIFSAISNAPCDCTLRQLLLASSSTAISSFVTFAGFSTLISISETSYKILSVLCNSSTCSHSTPLVALLDAKSLSQLRAGLIETLRPTSTPRQLKSCLEFINNCLDYQPSLLESLFENKIKSERNLSQAILELLTTFAKDTSSDISPDILITLYKMWNCAEVQMFVSEIANSEQFWQFVCNNAKKMQPTALSIIAEEVHLIERETSLPNQVSSLLKTFFGSQESVISQLQWCADLRTYDQNLSERISMKLREHKLGNLPLATPHFHESAENFFFDTNLIMEKLSQQFIRDPMTASSEESIESRDFGQSITDEDQRENLVGITKKANIELYEVSMHLRSVRSLCSLLKLSLTQSSTQRLCLEANEFEGVISECSNIMMSFSSGSAVIDYCLNDISSVILTLCKTLPTVNESIIVNLCGAASERLIQLSKGVTDEKDVFSSALPFLGSDECSKLVDSILTSLFLLTTSQPSSSTKVFRLMFPTLLTILEFGSQTGIALQSSTSSLLLLLAKTVPSSAEIDSIPLNFINAIHTILDKLFHSETSNPKIISAIFQLIASLCKIPYFSEQMFSNKLFSILSDSSIPFF